METSRRLSFRLRRAAAGSDRASPSDAPITADGKAYKKSTNPYVLLFVMLIVAAAATWVVPAGQFERVERGSVKFVVPNSLHAVERHGITPGDVMMAIAKGVIDSAPIIFLILATGGALAVLERTGAIGSALNGIGRSKSKDLPIIIGLCAIFSLLGTVGAVLNSVVAFVPIGLLLARSMRLPPILGVALIYLGTYSGFNSAILSPSTTALSQRLAELPIFSGLGFRAVVYVCFALAAITFLIAKVQNHRKSQIDVENYEAPAAAPTGPAEGRTTVRQWFALAFAALSLSTFVYGAVQLNWAEEQMIATFLVIAIGAGVICRLDPSEVAEEFVAGCGKLMNGALIVGLARAISIVLGSGLILDTIVNFLCDLLAPLSSFAAAIGMFVAAAAMHVVISSGSGESAALIPIFAPLGDSLHLTRQITVTAVLLGEGIMNCFNPTSGVLMAVLASGKIAYGDWVRFVMPLIAMWFVICIIALVVGVAINLGPF
jgi:uncharacterized ion transporter superfamily protein YfcC